nr:LysM-repeat proteins and domains [uncultured bacterium]
MGIEYMKHFKLFIFLCILTFTVSCGQQKRFIQYKVEKGETISAIASKLNMKTQDLLRLNPDSTSEPVANSFIVVPEKKLNNYKNKIKENPEVIIDPLSNEDKILDEKARLLEELKEKFVIYEVKKGDTFYNFKKNFNLTRGQLLILNPELVAGLKVGQILKIKEIPVEMVFDEIFYEDYIEPLTSVKVALLLPFRTSNYNNDTITIQDIFTKNATLVNIATDFYLGAEMAVDSLRGKGVNIELNVIDTGSRRGEGIRNILSNNDLGSNQAIIGPLYSEEVDVVASAVTIPVIFPVYSHKQSGFSATNIIKTSPEKSVFREELERYIIENIDSGSIIIVSDDKMKNIQMSRLLKASLELEDSINNVHILTPNEGYIEKSRFLEVLLPNTKNWVILATDDNVIVSDAINSLISLPEETTAKVFTFDKGSVYNKIDNRKLAKVGFTYVSEEFVDENSLEARIFRKQYVKKNKALPSFYATKGFDITYDILVRLASGNDLKTTFKQGASARVETKFDYRASSTENHGLFIVQYNEDLTVTKLK